MTKTEKKIYFAENIADDISEIEELYSFIETGDLNICNDLVFAMSAFRMQELNEVKEYYLTLIS